MSKDININFKTITSKARGWLQKLRKYIVFIFFVAVALMYSFLVFRINRLSSNEPTDDQVTERLQTVRRPKVDQNTLDKIQQLQDNSADVRALFKAARDNPFKE